MASVIIARSCVRVGSAASWSRTYLRRNNNIIRNALTRAPFDIQAFFNYVTTSVSDLVLRCRACSSSCSSSERPRHSTFKMITCKIMAWRVARARRGASRAPPPITASVHYAIGHCFGGEVCFAFKLCVIFCSNIHLCKQSSRP